MNRERERYSIDNNLLVENILKSKEQVKKFMGYGNRKMPPIIEKKIEEELSAIEGLIEPSYYYQILDLEESKEFRAYEIFEKLESSTRKIALIIYTVGSKVEEKINYYSHNQEMIRALILDKIAVVALDSLRDMLINKIQEQTQLKRIYEVYPTNKDFPISGQGLIYSKVCNEGIALENISINEYYQLSPIKSVAVAVVLGEKEKEFDRCKECGACKGEAL